MSKLLNPPSSPLKAILRCGLAIVTLSLMVASGCSVFQGNVTDDEAVTLQSEPRKSLRERLHIPAHLLSREGSKYGKTGLERVATPAKPGTQQEPEEAEAPEEQADRKQEEPAGIEAHLLPDDHAWSKMARIRGFDWPLLMNEGVCRTFEPEEGVASYYYRPQKLATGEMFNPEHMTAAHRTLPFGTIVRCVRTDTGKSVVVVINDRGPFIDGRIIDLSKAAAEQLNQIDAGIVPCRVEVLAYPLVESMGPKGNG